jgi:thiol-disulfide isomerase/thioredoxin
MSLALSLDKWLFRRSFSLIVSFLFSGVIMVAQPAIISGNAPDFAGMKIALFAQEDYVSGMRAVLGTSETDEKGAFHFEVNLESPRELILSAGGVEGILHAAPAKKYRVILPKPGNTQARTFDRTPVDLGLPEAKADDVNLLIRSFNRDYTRFINDHFYHFALEQYRGSESFRANQERKGAVTDMLVPPQPSSDTSAIVIVTEQRFGQLVNEFAVRVHEKYGKHYSDAYFRDYVRYSLAELELMSGTSRPVLYTEYFMSQPVQPTHSGYMKFFHVFYQGALTDPKPALFGDIIKAINADKSGTRAADLLRDDPLFQSPAIRSLAVIKGIRDAAGNNNYNRQALESSLEELSQRDADAAMREIASRTLAQMRRGQGGSTPEDFTLLDSNNDPWRWSEQPESYTYLIFFADWCTACKKDLIILENIWQKYEKHIRFVAINMDEQYGDFESYLSSHRNQKFTFLYGGNDPLLRQKFNLRSIPHAVLIGPDGKLVSDYTRRPGEGIQTDFDKIVKRAAENPGSGTWKDRQ